MKCRRILLPHTLGTTCAARTSVATDASIIEDTSRPSKRAETCSVLQSDVAPLLENDGQCVSRDSFPRERCGGYCNPGDENCTCCSIGSTVGQLVLFDCAVNGTSRAIEQRFIEVRRIQSCTCHVCHQGCAVRQVELAPLKIEQNRCLSRESIPKERCGGECPSDSHGQCRCCSVGKTYLRPYVFDCLLNGTRNGTEQKTVQIRRIQSCNCRRCKRK